MKLNNLLPALVFSGLTITGLLFFRGHLYAQDDTAATAAKDIVQLREVACKAQDIQSFKNCIEQARSKIVPIIKLDAPLACRNRSECQFDFSQIPGGVIVESTKPENKIVRSQDYGYTLFTANNSAQLHFTDLIIEDQDTTPCPQGMDCPPVISVNNSSNVTFKHLIFNNTHGTSLAITESRYISVTGSQFNSSLEKALEITSKGSSENMIVEGNTFRDNGSNALIFQIQSPSDKRSSIANNRFVNNHSKASYPEDCKYPCIGSQLRIKGPTSYLDVKNNLISDNPSKSSNVVGLYTSGLELESNGLFHLNISCNDINNNRASGIVQTQPVVLFGDIQVNHNKIWDNGINVNTPPIKEDTNCYSNQCKPAECL